MTIKDFFVNSLIGFGTVLTLLSGGCTLFFTIALADGYGLDGGLIISLMFGGIPILIGLLFMYIGWRKSKAETNNL